MVLRDEVLHAVANAEPDSADALLAVDGVTPALLERYGAPLLRLLESHARGETAPGAPADRRSPAAARPPAGDPTPEEAALYGRLKELRNRLAREANLPAYCIFADRTLIALARARPGDEDEMLSVSGVGPAKLEKYGDAFLRCIRGDD